MGNITNMMAAGFPAEQAKAIVGTIETGVTATGTGQSDAYTLKADATIFSTVSASTGCAIPSTLPVHSEIRIYNAGASNLSVYPPTGCTINDESANAAVICPAGEGCTIVRLSNTLFGAVGVSDLTATELEYLDGVTAGTAAASKAVVLGASKEIASLGKVTFGTATGGLMAGGGASGANHALGSTAGNALEWYLNATHTTGDMRGEYIRLYFSGAGGSGEALRAFSTINNVPVATAGTVNGAHVSIGTAGASAAVSGAANALRATFGIAAASTNIGGTCAVIQADTDFDTAVTVPTNFAFMRFTNTNTKKSNNLIRVPDVAAETGGLFCAHVTQTMTHSIKFVSENGTAYYIMCTNANTNRTES